MTRWLVIRENDSGDLIVENAIALADNQKPVRKEGEFLEVRPGDALDNAGKWHPPAIAANWLLIVYNADGTAKCVDAIAADDALELVAAAGELEHLGPGWTRTRAGVWTAPTPIADEVAPDDEA